jgi:hypothetical protein
MTYNLDNQEERNLYAMSNQEKEKHIDDCRDIAIRIVDKLVEEGYVKNCIDTDDDTEFEIQDIILNELLISKFN